MMGHDKGHDCVMCRLMFGGGKAEFKCEACGAKVPGKEELAKHSREKHDVKA